jgi:sarcosine oxidase subunit gamma
MAAEALTRLVRIDLDPASFYPGACAATELHGMSVQLRRTSDGETYECAVSRSFAGSLYHSLTNAEDPYGLSVEPASHAR